MPIRAITFDFWSTLFRDANNEPRQRLRVDAFAEATGVPHDEVDKALATVWVEFERCHRVEQRTLEPCDAVRMTADSLGVTMDAATFDRLTEAFAVAILSHSPEPVDGVFEAVGAAAARVPIGVISDSGVSPGTSLRQLLARHGLLEPFRVLNFSDELGVAKPQRPMFQTAIEALGVAPHELLHIGDLEYSDIAGAHAVGAKAALFTNVNPRFADATTADYVFPSWAAFTAALDALVG